MFALGVRYLNGWSMAASDGASKSQPEWPPHPDRVFMAMAAAWFETGEDVDEGCALQWLEALPPPAIYASRAAVRSSFMSYVPVNDDGGGKKTPKNELDRLRYRGLAVVPEHRLRQPRGFPVAIPHDPSVYMIWSAADLNGHLHPLGRLVGKVTYVGHSASFVQAWIETHYEISATWEPSEGIGLQMRVPFAGRLQQLKRFGSSNAWNMFHDLSHEIRRAEVAKKEIKHPPRVAWGDFPVAVLLASEVKTKQRLEYAAAKAGDMFAAADLVEALVTEDGIIAVQELLTGLTSESVTLVSAHAYERASVNAIPIALARLLGKRLELPFEQGVVQSNIVSHTGADGYGRLARQASFEGQIDRGSNYLIVDDFIGQGGTLANLRGWVEKRGGTVVGAVALTGKPYSAKLGPSEEQLDELRQRHGKEFERWWLENYGHSFDCLTHSEARYLARSPDVNTIRNRLAAAKQGGNGEGGTRSPREQSRHIRELKAKLEAQFADGQPPEPRRPPSGRWQGYRRVQSECYAAIPGSSFDSRIVILGLSGARLSLHATLRVANALRGLLLRNCPEQPPPEWFSGHTAAGAPSNRPHLAIVPLAFVGSQHSDGRIMGMAVILPSELNPQEARNCIAPILRDSSTGLPRSHRLFDGKWMECGLEHETRESPPLNLRPETWSGGARGSRVWASVTPVVLNRHFDGEDRWQRAAEGVKTACEHIGLPRPRETMLHAVSPVEGVPHAREFARIKRKSDGGYRSHSHAVLIFDEPVRGPVLIGAGRFRGYGLCRPMDSEPFRPSAGGASSVYRGD